MVSTFFQFLLLLLVRLTHLHKPLVREIAAYLVFVKILYNAVKCLDALVGFFEFAGLALQFLTKFLFVLVPYNL